MAPTQLGNHVDTRRASAVPSRHEGAPPGMTAASRQPEEPPPPLLQVKPIVMLPAESLAAELAESGLRVIHIPSDGHCLFGAFARSFYGTAAEQGEFRLLLADVLRRPGFEKANETIIVSLRQEGFATAAEYAKRVVRSDHWGTYTDAVVLCNELGWRLAVYNTIEEPPHDKIAYVEKHDSPDAAHSKVIELLHTPTHWDLLERVVEETDVAAVVVSPSGLQGAGGLAEAERGRLGSH